MPSYSLGLAGAALALAAAGCAPPHEDPRARESRTVPAAPPPAVGPAPTKRLEFAILEDYDKGAPLADVERDFRLFRELGIRTWRGSLGWDDYEPARGRYDLAWLHRFAALARREGITLRPYLGYTPEWAAAGRRADGQTWNDPPARPADFARFAGRLAAELRRHGSVASYEIYNEENTKLWWDGTAGEYADLFVAAADSIRAADPGAAVLMGGLVWPDAEWAEDVCRRGRRLAAVPVHVYAETWTPDSVTLERAVADLESPPFREAVDGPCGAPPVWANEIGFATARGRSERDQADWWVRAIAALAAAPHVTLVGVYEIKDLAPGSAVIGEAENYHLGLTRADRAPKLAFRTVRLMVSLLAGELAVADAELRVAPAAAGPDVHLFRRPDGRQVLVAWARRGRPAATLDVTLPRAGAAATSYALDGTGTPLPLAGGGTLLRALRVSPGTPRIVVVSPTATSR
ncbi:MAG: beta-galactosidase [Gemmatimonadaceae bacterium]